MAAGDERTPIDDVREMVREGVEKLTREGQANADHQEEPGGPGVAVEPERPEPVGGPDGPGGPGDLHEPPSEVDDGAIDGDGRPDLVDGGPPTGEQDGRGAEPGAAADLDPSSPAPSLDGAMGDTLGGGPDWSDPDVQDGLTFATEWLEASGVDTSQLTNQQIADQFGAIVDSAEHELYGEMSEAYLQNEGISTEGMTDQEKIDAAVEHADGVEHQMLVSGSRNYLQQELGIDTEGMTDQQIIDRAQQHLDSAGGNQVPLLEGSVGRAVDAALNGDLDAFTTALGEFGVATERTMFAVTEALNEIAEEVETAVDEALAPAEEEAPPEDDTPDEDDAPPEDDTPDEDDAPPEDDTPDGEDEDGDDDAGGGEGEGDDDAGDDDAGEDGGDEGEGDDAGGGDGGDGGEGDDAGGGDGGDGQTGQPAEPGTPSNVPGFTPEDLQASLEESTRYTEVTRAAERDSRIQYADTPGSETGGTPSTKPDPNPVDPADPEYDKGAPVSADVVRGTIGGDIDPHDDPSGSDGGASGAPGGAPLPPGNDPVAAEDFGRGAGGPVGSDGPQVEHGGADADVAGAASPGAALDDPAGIQDGGEAGADDGGFVDVELADDVADSPPSGGFEAEVDLEDHPADLGGSDVGIEDAM